MIKSFISGHFNVLHSGHLRLFKFAKNRSDKLIVGIYEKPLEKNKYMFPLITRIAVLKACNLVDDVLVIKENQLKKNILKIQPNIIVKGSEFKFKNNVEEDFINKRKIKLLFSSGEKVKLNIQKREIFKEGMIFEKKYLTRNNLNFNKIHQVIDKFKKLSLCVIGDIIIDEYCYHEPLGMSQEDFSIVVKPLDTNTYLGGAGIVAAHAAALKAKSHLISIIGKEKNLFIKNKLKNYGVRNLITQDDNRLTTIKKKIKLVNKPLLRINNFSDDFISKKNQNIIYNKLVKIIKSVDVLIFSDFNYGILPSPLIERITALCKKNSVITCADSQLSSQVGDILRFKNLDLLSQTEFEIRSSLRNNNDGLVKIMNDFAKNTSAENIFLKLGDQGLIINKYENIDQLFTDKLESFNKIPVDPSGAGDSLLVLSSMAYAITKDIWLSAYLGSLGASIQVSREGNVPISYNELISLSSNLK